MSSSRSSCSKKSRKSTKHWAQVRGSRANPIIGLTTRDGVYYDFCMDKRAETVSEVLGEFGATLTVDGISIYPAVQKMHHDGHRDGIREGPPF